MSSGEATETSGSEPFRRPKRYEARRMRIRRYSPSSPCCPRRFDDVLSIRRCRHGIHVGIHRQSQECVPHRFHRSSQNHEEIREGSQNFQVRLRDSSRGWRHGEIPRRKRLLSRAINSRGTLEWMRDPSRVTALTGYSCTSSSDP